LTELGRLPYFRITRLPVEPDTGPALDFVIYE
jgi:hypothetical protein